MSALRLVLHQYSYDQKMFWRTPAAVFFTVALPVIFLFLFVSIFGDYEVAVDGRTVRTAQVQVPALLALGIVSATLVNLAIGVTGIREGGGLKRLRATPLPMWAFVGARTLTAAVVALLLVVALSAIAWVVYDVKPPVATLPGALLSTLIGVFSFSALGFALTTIIRSENAAPAVANAIVLPLYFISGIFLPAEELPTGLRSAGEFFPISHLYEALLLAFTAPAGPGIDAHHLLVVFLWGVIGVLVSAMFFRWEPVSRRS